MQLILPTVLHSSPVAAVRRTLSDYSLRSRRVANMAFRYGTKRNDASDVHCSRQLVVANPAGSKTKYVTQGRYILNKLLAGPLIYQIGSQLLNTALAESQMEHPSNQAFSRHLYINSMSYLLHGLPSDLDEHERLQLQSALPDALSQAPQPIEATSNNHDPSILHRGVAVLVISLCLLIKIVVPYFKYLFTMAYDYERTHHIAETVLDRSTSSINTFGKRSMELAGSAMENETLMRSVDYCVQGVCGGLNEGIGEGLRANEARHKI